MRILILLSALLFTTAANAEEDFHHLRAVVDRRFVDAEPAESGVGAGDLSAHRQEDAQGKRVVHNAGEVEGSGGGGGQG